MADKPTIGNVTFGNAYNPENPPPGSVGGVALSRLPIVPSRPNLEDPIKTLRDEFAMAALTGVIRSESLRNTSRIAQIAYEIADDMLKARNA